MSSPHSGPPSSPPAEPMDGDDAVSLVDDAVSLVDTSSEDESTTAPAAAPAAAVILPVPTTGVHGMPPAAEPGQPALPEAPTQAEFTYAVDDMARLRRFVVLGVESACYSSTEQEVGLANAQALMRLLTSGRGHECVALLAEYAREGRCAKQNPLVFALAMCVRFGDKATRKEAYAVLGDVCSIPTTFFTFLEYVKLLYAGSSTTNVGDGAGEELEEDGGEGSSGAGARPAAAARGRRGRSAQGRQNVNVRPQQPERQSVAAAAKTGSRGWGRMHREGVSNWYNKQDAMRLAMNLTKYRVRKGWSHRDVLRLCHATPASDAHQLCFQHVAVPKMSALGPEDRLARAKSAADNAKAKAVAEFLCATAKARVCENLDALMELIKQHRLVREHVPTTMLDKPAVWAALLPGMPLMALLRNINKMTAIGVLSEDTEEGRAHVQMVIDKLGSEEALKAARIHPFNVLLAQRTYAQGRGFKGSLQWNPIPRLVRALETAYYASFRHVQPTGKRLVVAIDVSGSMSSLMMGSPLSSRDAAAALLMTFLRTEEHCRVVAFSDNIVELPFTRDWTLEQVVAHTEGMDFSATDCSLAMQWAEHNGVAADAFVVITDNETNSGHLPPATTLRNYRSRSGIPDAKLAVLATSAGHFSIADPEDRGMLDMAGMDSAVPALLSGFIEGKL